MPAAELLIFGTKTAALAMLRSAMMAAPTSLDSSSDFTEAGDTGTDVSFDSFTGISPGTNCTLDTGGQPKVWVKLTNTGSGYTLSVFKDSGLASLVAEATGLAGNSTGNVIAEKNDSTLTAVADIGTGSTNSGITVVFDTLRPQWGTQISEYFTLFDDDGGKLWKLHDCVVNRVEFQHGVGENLMIGVEIFAQNWNAATTSSLTAAVSDFTPYTISDSTVTRDPASSAVALQLSNIVASIQQEEIVQFVGNDTKPKLILDGRHACPISIEGRMGDEVQTMLDNSLAVTFEKLRIAWTLSAKTMQFDYENPELEPDIPGFDNNLVEELSLAGEGYFDGTTNPLVITIGF